MKASTKVSAVAGLSACLLGATGFAAPGRHSTISAGTNMTAASSSRTATSSKTKTTLVIWWWGQQEAPGASTWMKQTVASFEKLHPTVTVQTTLQTTNGLYPAFETAAKAKTGPDIQYLWGGTNTLTEAWNGYLAPIDNYIPKSQWTHYLNWQEDYYSGHLWSAPWYTQPSFPILYNKAMFKKAGLNPNDPPTTWTQFLKDCSVLKAHNITPLAMGLSGGNLGGWLFSFMGDQNLNSANQILKAQVSGNIDQKKYTEWLYKFNQLVKLGYFNSNISSLQQYQGEALFSEGKAAMTWVPGTAVSSYVQTMGVNKVGIMLTPVFGTGKLAGTIGATSQTLAISSFSHHKRLAAEFIEFAHTPTELNLFYKDTGAIPADNRFQTSQITLPQEKALYSWMLHKPGAYLENYISLQLDNNGNFAGVQDIASGAKTPQEVGAMMQQIVELWRKENPLQVTEFKNWHVQPWY